VSFRFFYAAGLRFLAKPAGKQKAKKLEITAIKQVFLSAL
jgi:hypothetical protein